MTARSTAVRHRYVEPPLSKGMFDGRTRVARRRRELIEIYANALGGASGLHGGQIVDIRKAAELTSLAEQSRARAMRGILSASEISAMIRLESTASRAVRALNIQQNAVRSNLPSPAEYLAQRAARPAVPRSAPRP
jgi:hypothetical protein